MNDLSMNEHGQRRRDLHDVIPKGCRDILALAEKAVERYWADPSMLNLYPMVLLTAHVADWYVNADLDPGKKIDFVVEFKAAYPRWNAIRDVGNGLKHSQIGVVGTEQFASEDMAWEHQGWWEGVAYGTDYNGKKVPIDILCADFIKEFSGDLMVGCVRDRLPLLHQAALKARESRGPEKN